MGFLVVCGVAVVVFLTLEVALRRRYPDSDVLRGKSPANDRLVAIVGTALAAVVLVLAIPALVARDWLVLTIQVLGALALGVLSMWRWRRGARSGGVSQTTPPPSVPSDDLRPRCGEVGTQ